MIPDTHGAPAGWGVRPVLLDLGGLQVGSYAFFVGLGLVVAVALYYLRARREQVGSEGLYIAMAAAIGGIIGAKVPMWLANLPRILAEPGNLELLLSGRTIVGGVIGGAAAVFVTKRVLHIKTRLGNLLVPSLCAGIVLGRIGCFLAGCCYGTATSLPWGVDFGDGVLRHPTQLYEAVFVLGLLAYALVRGGAHKPGELFWAFMIAYFTWRFAVEFVRVSPAWGMGLTYYQVVSVAVVLAYIVKVVVGAREGARA